MTAHNRSHPEWRLADVGEVRDRIARVALGLRDEPMRNANKTDAHRSDSSREDWGDSSCWDSGEEGGNTSDKNSDNNSDSSSSSNNSDSRIGSITLRPHQIDAVRRLKVSIATHGGALLADTVGLGKTYVALSLARLYATVHVLAPAALLPMWRKAIAITNNKHATVQSLHALSQRSWEPAALKSHERRLGRAVSPETNAVALQDSKTGAPRAALIVVDEAHYLRTRSTLRYRNTARICAGHDVLLISATPLHNRPRELQNLLALFLGARADSLDASVLAACIVRRSGNVAPLSMPVVRQHAVKPMPDNPAVLECILTVASPVPAQDGRQASVLVRLGLLRAWCSSDAALTDTIRRRQLRGEALLHALAHGRHPTRRELQSWIVGTDSVQLGFAELLVDTVTSASSELLKALTRHLDSLQALLQLHLRTSRTDAIRLEYLRQLLHESSAIPSVRPAHAFEHVPAHAAPHPSAPAGTAEPGPIVAFSQFASTVRALHRALGDIAGIASLTSNGGRIASGTIPREELIAQFAPRANGRPPPPARDRIRLLLTTDLLAEGVNLQDANTVVHLDLPWTDALRKQRVGRAVRLGSSHAVVHVHTFAPPMRTEQALRVVSLLEQKAGLHRQWVGSESSARPVTVKGVATAAAYAIVGNEPTSPAPVTDSAAEQATLLRDRFQAWIGTDAADDHCSTRRVSNVTPVAVVPAASSGFLAAVATGDHVTILTQSVGTIGAAVADGTDGTRVPGVTAASSALPDLLRAIQSIDGEISRPAPTISESNAHANIQVPLRFALDQIDSWFAERAVHAVAGASARELAPIQQRALQHVAERLGLVSAASRRGLRLAVHQTELAIMDARGLGAEQALNDWVDTLDRMPLADWLHCVPKFRAAASRLNSANQDAANQGSRVLALILLVPDQRDEVRGRLLE